jgi:hypothetical protein
MIAGTSLSDERSERMNSHDLHRSAAADPKIANADSGVLDSQRQKQQAHGDV